MENKNILNNLQLLEKLSVEFNKIDDSIACAHLVSDFASQVANLLPMIKVDGSVFLLLTQGNLKLNYNYDEIEVNAPAIISFPPGTTVKIDPKNSSEIDAHIIVYTHSFLQDVNISFSAVSGEAILGRKSPHIELKEREAAQILRYFTLIRSTIADQFNVQLTKHIASSLTSALFYQSMLLLYKQIEVKSTDSSVGPRRGTYVHDFLKLVHVYYTKERSVNFYASQLYISPKYLSLLVKEATGRSAAKWIDYFVITEAKNLLRYSGKNIQQVAYALNFSNQSSFGKYFKHLTGMSPTDYQNMNR